MCSIWKYEDVLIVKEKLRLYDWDEELLKEQKKLMKELMKLFKRLYKEYEKELKENTYLSMNDKIEKMSDGLFDKMLEVIGKALKRGFLRWAKRLWIDVSKFEPDLDISFEVSSDKAKEWAKENAWILVTRVDKTTRKRINKIIEKALESGEGYNDVMKVLKKDFSFSHKRARLIASTELWNSYEAGKEEEFKLLQEKHWVEWWKKWKTHEDDRVSDGCRENSDAWWIPNDDTFPSGHSRPLRFPWCRCHTDRRLSDPRI